MCDAKVSHIYYAVRSKCSQDTGAQYPEHKGVSAAHLQSLDSNETKELKERDAGVGLGSTAACETIFGCKMLDLIIADTSSCQRESIKGPTFEAVAFVSPQRISAHLCLFLI